MKFQFYHEKLINSDEYQKFVKENPKAFPSSGFFTVDLEKKENDLVHFDFFLPEEKKMYSFKMSGPVEFVNVENFDPRVPEKLSFNYDFDLKDFVKLIDEKKTSEGVKGEVKKYLFSLQKLEGVDYFVVTVFLNNMALIKCHIDIASKKIESFEKKSFLDMFKIIKKK